MVVHAAHLELFWRDCLDVFLSNLLENYIRFLSAPLGVLQLLGPLFLVWTLCRSVPDWLPFMSLAYLSLFSLFTLWGFSWLPPFLIKLLYTKVLLDSQRRNSEKLLIRFGKSSCPYTPFFSRPILPTHQISLEQLGCHVLTIRSADFFLDTPRWCKIMITCLSNSVIFVKVVLNLLLASSEMNLNKMCIVRHKKNTTTCGSNDE